MFRIEKTENPLQLLSDIRRGQWFVHDHESLLPTALSFLRGESIAAAQRPAFEFSAVDSQVAAAATQVSSNKAQKVAVIPIVGPITKYDSWCNYGATTYARAISEAGAHPEVCAIVLDFDSGGGAVNAISIMKEAISYVQSLGKPIIAHVDFCASLAYWAASQCDAVFCDNNVSSAVGSIGALCHFVDDAGKLKQDGYTVVTVYADESPDKNLAYRRAIEGDDTAIKKELSYLVAQFHQDVLNTRPDVKADAPGVFTGAMFSPAEAQTLGLINGVHTLSECIENAAIRAHAV